MIIQSWAKKLARRAGYELRPWAASFGGKYQRFLPQFGVSLVLDVGAHIGDYAQTLRRLGYGNRIVSFEPMAAAFAKLQARAQTDPRWTAVNVALGNTNGRALLNVSGMPMSSSLLDMLPRHLNAAPASAYVSTEAVEVCALDTIFSQYYQAGDKVFMKLDTQGYERTVLEGAVQSLPTVVGLQVELSFAPLYAGETTIGPMVDYLGTLGYGLMALAPGFEAPDGRLMQAYALFFRSPP